MTQESLFHSSELPNEGFDPKSFFEQLAQGLLAEYVEELRRAKRTPSAKEINDSVWQTIALRPVEVILLDSPLFQRLRHIKQLGVAHYVYPGAAHSRLEHSVGVMHQMQALVDAVNRSAPSPGIPPETEHLLRLIALCHDLGHGVMSHVAENALVDFDEVQEVVFDFVDSVGTEKAKLSEVAAYYLVGSPAFGELLRAARELVPNYALPRDTASKIQDAIVGKKISDEYPLLNELISGPFDADKLDYMTRDAQRRELLAKNVALCDWPNDDTRQK